MECRPLTDHSYYSERPKLIIEVLSDSTKRDDRSDKFYAYRRLASLEEYVLVARDEQRVRSTAAPMDGMRWSMARKIAFDSKASALIWPLLQSTPETRFCGFAETPRYAWYSSTEVPITLESFLALYGFQTGTRG